LSPITPKTMLPTRIPKKPATKTMLNALLSTLKARSTAGAPTLEALKSSPSTKRMRTPKVRISAWKAPRRRCSSSDPTSTSRI
jgi:hypothetical protein